MPINSSEDIKLRTWVDLNEFSQFSTNLNDWVLGLTFVAQNWGLNLFDFLRLKTGHSFWHLSLKSLGT